MVLEVDEIREYVRDTPSLNILLEGRLQSEDSHIEMGMKLAVSDFNSAAPVSHYTVETFPSAAIILYGTLHHMCNMEAERQLRNNVNYNAQGLNAGIDDKFGQYNQLATYYKQLLEARTREFKQYVNVSQAWGGELSPYAGINEYQFRS